LIAYEDFFFFFLVIILVLQITEFWFWIAHVVVCTALDYFLHKK